MIDPAWEAWFAQKPPCVRQMAEEFPPGSKVEVADRAYFVLGWGENKGTPSHLVVSAIDPREDYDAAVEATEHLCLCCARAGSLRH